jgi:hypothetical protein
MFYMIHYAGDSRWTSHPQFEWFHIRGKRQEAMQFARQFAEDMDLKVKYLCLSSDKSMYDFDAKEYLIVQQTKEYTFGC